MNNFPKTVSKLAMLFGALTCVVPEAAACGPSGPGEYALLLALIAAIVLVPALLSAAGVAAAVRVRRSGLSLGRGLVGTAALLCELGVARAAGPGSLLGLMAVGVGALQIALFAMAAYHGPDEAPLRGRITVLSDQALGF